MKRCFKAITMLFILLVTAVVAFNFVKPKAAASTDLTVKITEYSQNDGTSSFKVHYVNSSTSTDYSLGWVASTSSSYFCVVAGGSTYKYDITANQTYNESAKLLANTSYDRTYQISGISGTITDAYITNVLTLTSSSLPVNSNANGGAKVSVDFSVCNASSSDLSTKELSTITGLTISLLDWTLEKDGTHLTIQFANANSTSYSLGYNNGSKYYESALYLTTQSKETFSVPFSGTNSDLKIAYKTTIKKEVVFDEIFTEYDSLFVSNILTLNSSGTPTVSDYSTGKCLSVFNKNATPKYNVTSAEVLSASIDNFSIVNGTANFTLTIVNSSKYKCSLGWKTTISDMYASKLLIVTSKNNYSVLLSSQKAEQENTLVAGDKISKKITIEHFDGDISKVTLSNTFLISGSTSSPTTYDAADINVDYSSTIGVAPTFDASALSFTVESIEKTIIIRVENNTDLSFDLQYFSDYLTAGYNYSFIYLQPTSYTNGYCASNSVTKLEYKYDNIEDLYECHYLYFDGPAVYYNSKYQSLEKIVIENNLYGEKPVIYPSNDLVYTITNADSNKDIIDFRITNNSSRTYSFSSQRIKVYSSDMTFYVYLEGLSLEPNSTKNVSVTSGFSGKIRSFSVENVTYNGSITEDLSFIVHDSVNVETSPQTIIGNFFSENMKIILIIVGVIIGLFILSNCLAASNRKKERIKSSKIQEEQRKRMLDNEKEAKAIKSGASYVPRKLEKHRSGSIVVGVLLTIVGILFLVWISPDSSVGVFYYIWKILSIVVIIVGIVNFARGIRRKNILRNGKESTGVIVDLRRVTQTQNNNGHYSTYESYEVDFEYQDATGLRCITSTTTSILIFRKLFVGQIIPIKVLGKYGEFDVAKFKRNPDEYEKSTVSTTYTETATPQASTPAMTVTPVEKTKPVNNPIKDEDVKHKLFISYRRDYVETAMLFKYGLSKHYDVFLDDDLSVGKWKNQLETAINEAEALVVIIATGTLNRKPNGQDIYLEEIAAGIRQGKLIIPVIIKPFEEPENNPFWDRLCDYQFVWYDRKDNMGTKHALQQLKEYIDNGLK